jgi:putative ABC transport system ATP-binding protein
VQEVHVFEAKNVSRSSILKDLTFTVASGSLITIIGPSGSGKSTLLGLLNRMSSPERGSLSYQGTPLDEWDVLALRRQVRMVFQTPTMLPGTVRDNLTAALPPKKGELPDPDRAHDLIRSLGLEPEMLERQATDLSGGQKARVALGRALYDRPRVLLCDELTASLDPESTRLIEELVLTYQKQEDATCLWVTHDLRQARTLGTETWVVDHGELVETGPTEEIFASPKHPSTQRLLFQLHETTKAGV